MKKFKSVGKKLLAGILCVVVCAGVYHYSPHKETSAAIREPAYEGILILNEDVPLGFSEDAMICMQALRLINDYRQAHGLKALLWNNDLEAAAAVRADEARSCWSHTRPNGQPWYTVNPSIMYGENLGRGYSDADSLVQAWKDSPTHNENLLYADFKYAAISCVNDVYALEFA